MDEADSKRLELYMIGDLIYFDFMYSICSYPHEYAPLSSVTYHNRDELFLILESDFKEYDVQQFMVKVLASNGVRYVHNSYFDFLKQVSSIKNCDKK